MSERKEMILINDEVKNKFIDIEVRRMRIENQIEMLLNDVDIVKYLPKKRIEIIDAINAYQNELREITEMEKTSFDVLVVVEKEKDEYSAMVQPPSI